MLGGCMNEGWTERQTDGQDDRWMEGGRPGTQVSAVRTLSPTFQQVIGWGLWRNLSSCHRDSPTPL